MADKTRDYVVGGWRYTMPATSCLFCAHCTDLVYDYTNSIYMIFCDERDTDHVWDFGVRGKCDTFEPDGTEAEVTNDAQG